MPTDPFTEALDALEAEVRLRCAFPYGSQMEYEAARARVQALFAEVAAERDDLMAIVIGDKVRKPSNPSLAERQGEVYEVVSIYSDDDEYRRDVVDVTAKLSRGDKVRVTKVEEGQ